MVTHSSILAWKIPSTEETVGPQSKEGKELDTTEQLTHHTEAGEEVTKTLEKPFSH